MRYRKQIWVSILFDTLFRYFFQVSILFDTLFRYLITIPSWTNFTFLCPSFSAFFVQSYLFFLFFFFLRQNWDVKATYLPEDKEMPFGHYWFIKRESTFHLWNKNIVSRLVSLTVPISVWREASHNNTTDNTVVISDFDKVITMQISHFNSWMIWWV